MIEHGGNLIAASERYGVHTEDWLDLSTGVSPFPYPVPPICQQAWHRLPVETLEFRKAAASYYETDRFIPVPGSQSAIQLLPRLLDVRSVAIVSPTYAEHERCWRAAGVRVELVQEKGLDKAVREHDALVLCNPNNPTGSWWKHDELRAHLTRRGAWLIVDEAFIDTEPLASCASQSGTHGLVVLRSLGKFFGLAGARVGFLFGPNRLLERAAGEVGPWGVSGPGLEVATRALFDTSFAASARARLREASGRLRRVLETHGFGVSGGTHFFAWIRHDQARLIQDRLARRAILVRAFDNPAGLRFGLPGTDMQWQRLEDALATL